MHKLLREMQTSIFEVKFLAIVRRVYRQEKVMTIDDLQKLRGPARALIIAGSLNGVIGILALLGGLFSGIGRREGLPVDETERIGYVTGIVITDSASLISLLLAPVIIYGAVQMMKAKNYRAARIAAILVIIPFTSCCFLVGIPMGIWALVILGKPEIKAAFHSDGSLLNKYPPHPPQKW